MRNRRKYISPILGNKNEMVKNVISEHKRYGRLFHDSEEVVFNTISLTPRVRTAYPFRVAGVFNEVLKVSTAQQLKIISKLHTDEKLNDNSNDPF